VSFGFFGVTVLARDDNAIDVLDGGDGNDTYVIGDADDVILEAPDGGEDTVEASHTYALGENLENLTLTGEVPLVGTGNDGANRLRGDTSFVGFFEQTELYGLGGDDVLENGTWMDGGEGADVMIGRPGFQATYFVDDTADVVIEQPVYFVDEVFTTVTYTAPVNVENLTLIGTAAIDGYGNALTNRLTGNDAPNRLEDPFGSVFAAFGDRLFGMGGDDVLIAAFGDSVLDGGSGADLMRGGPGDDTYFADASGDRVEELAGEGFDTVHATASLALDDHTEVLYLEGELAIDGSGGAGDNVFYGNLAANRLAGGAGDDTYVVQNELDTVAELPGEGFDQVFTTASFVLGANVEAVTLEGDEPFDATGNDEANAIEGNDADNVLLGLGENDDIDGGAGNDTIEGGDGDDVLYGGARLDRYDCGPGNDVAFVENALEGQVASSNGCERVVIGDPSISDPAFDGLNGAAHPGKTTGGG
jgi:Ca2+-binding RTX toxin-like protein